MKLILLLTLCLVLAGCASADLVMTQSKPYRGGTVKYLNAGADFLIRQRRQDATTKAWQVCGGDFEITGEGDNPEGVMLYRSDYRYINFKCADKEKPTASI